MKSASSSWLTPLSRLDHREGEILSRETGNVSVCDVKKLTILAVEDDKGVIRFLVVEKQSLHIIEVIDAIDTCQVDDVTLFPETG